MSKDLNWVFEERDPLETASGEDVSGRVLRSSRLNDLAILGREGGQNTLNQPLFENHEKPVDVEVKLIELTGSHKEQYLVNLRWETLKQHLEASSKISSQASSALHLKSSLDEINNPRKSLYILNIEDSNCFGLTGPDEQDSKITKPNFFNLCKATFFTSETPQSIRGGSFGVGKSILWNCSKISTVLFSSLVQENKEERTPGGLRVFGRTSLSSHTIKDNHYRGPGFFGEPKDIRKINMAHSVWNNEDLAEKLFINRQPEKGTGATISIVGFDENKAIDYGLEGVDILIGIKEQFEKYFWPALALIPKKLNLSFVFQVNNKIRNEFNEKLKINLKKWKPFIDASNLNLNDTDFKKIANTPNSISKRNLNIKIPPRKIKIPELNKLIQSPTNTKFEISVKRESKDLSNHLVANTIALIRGFGMVVDYRKPDTSSLSSSLPYFAVVKVGKLLGQSENEVISETFFKDHEPELHDRWDAKVKGIETKYNKSSKIISDFYEKVDTNLLEMCGEEEKDGDKGPELLSKMLNMGFKKTMEQEYIISSKNIKAIPISDYIWSTSGTISISEYPQSEKEKKDKCWEVGFGFSIKEETSRGDSIPFKNIEFLDEKIEILSKDNDKELKIKIINTKEISFKGEINLKNILGNQNPKFCAINFYTK